MTMLCQKKKFWKRFQLLLIESIYQFPGWNLNNKRSSAQSAWAEEYADWISINECHRYDSKPFDGKTLVFEFWGIWSILSLRLLPAPHGSLYCLNRIV